MVEYRDEAGKANTRANIEAGLLDKNGRSTISPGFASYDPNADLAKAVAEAVAEKIRSLLASIAARQNAGGDVSALAESVTKTVMERLDSMETVIVSELGRASENATGDDKPEEPAAPAIDAEALSRIVASSVTASISDTVTHYDNAVAGIVPAMQSYLGDLETAHILEIVDLYEKFEKIYDMYSDEEPNKRPPRIITFKKTLAKILKDYGVEIGTHEVGEIMNEDDLTSECTETVTADEAEPRPEGTYRQDEIVKLLTAHYYMKAGKVIKVQQVITFTE